MASFTKMQAIGNDFICMNYDDIKQYNLKIFSKFVCDRHFGIGADGVILFSSSKVANFKMRIFNCDGSEAEMCGNGIRCLAKFLFENGYTNKNKILIETLAGIKEIEYVIQNKKIMSLKVKIGIPQININRLPVYIPRNYRYKDQKCKLVFKLGEKESVGTFLTVGNPHTVIEISDIKNYQVTKFGKIVENYKYFPQKTNVEFVEIIDNEHIKLRVWERGIGETYGCGTGAVAAFYALFIENKVKEKIDVEFEGGNLKVYVNKKGEVYIEGNAQNVFEGKIDL